MGNRYAADGKLMAQQVNRDLLPFGVSNTAFVDPWGVYEEYGYNALGS